MKLFKKKPEENRELIDMLKEQIKDLEPGSEEQQRAVKALAELEGCGRESVRTIQGWITTVTTVVGTGASLVLSYIMFKKPYDAQEKNIYVTDRIGQENIKEGKSGVKDAFRKFTR